MKTRRDFIRKTALGSAAIYSVGGLSVLSVNSCTEAAEINETKKIDVKSIDPTFSGWEVSFDEATSALLFTNGSISIIGQLNFVSGTDKWTIAKSRDGLPNRNAFVDLQGNVQGYFVCRQNCGQLKLYFYHRTAQEYHGVLSFEGKITFLADSFPCRTRAKENERILSFGCGVADSLLNDSLFAPESDTALLLDAANLRLETVDVGSYSVLMSGKIDESSEMAFTINLETDYLKNRFVPYYHAIDRKRCPKTPTGWMSWNTYFDKATAEDNLAEARIGQKYLHPFGCEFWSIESWQGNSDKLPVRNFYNMDLEVSKKKFPKGMKQLVADIRELGFRPGLWIAPFGTGNKKFYDTHKGWFLHDKEDKPISGWNGRYMLDPTVPEARAHLKKICKIASREWGYEFFKVDGMSGRNHNYCAHLYERPEIKARFRDISCSNPFELCLKAIREGIGKDRVFLACQGHTSGPDVLYADASRIGADIVHPNQPVQWSGVLSQGRCTANQLFTHNIVTISDPDTLLVNDLPLEEARVSTTIVALPGQMTFFADKLKNLPGERMKMLQQTLPVANVRPMSLYPYFSLLPVWNLRVYNTMLNDYNVVALFNWEDEAKTISFSTEELGVQYEGKYLLYEFWTQKAYGTIKDSFALKVPAHGVRLLAMHKEKSIPQWISSDRHITQNAIEIKEYEWVSGSQTLEGKIELIGSFPLTMRLHVPQDFHLSGAECSGAKCTVKQEEKDILAITFKSDHTGDFDFRIRS